MPIDVCIACGSPLTCGYSQSLGLRGGYLVKPTITQCTAAFPGASESHSNVRCANFIFHPSRYSGPNRAGTGWPWVMELVVTKANSPKRSWSKSFDLACQPVT